MTRDELRAKCEVLQAVGDEQARLTIDALNELQAVRKVLAQTQEKNRTLADGNRRLHRERNEAQEKLAAAAVPKPDPVDDKERENFRYIISKIRGTITLAEALLSGARLHKDTVDHQPTFTAEELKTLFAKSDGTEVTVNDVIDLVPESVATGRDNPAAIKNPPPGYAGHVERPRFSAIATDLQTSVAATNLLNKWHEEKRKEDEAAKNPNRRKDDEPTAGIRDFVGVTFNGKTEDGVVPQPPANVPAPRRPSETPVREPETASEATGEELARVTAIAKEFGVDANEGRALAETRNRLGLAPTPPEGINDVTPAAAAGTYDKTPKMKDAAANKDV